jgi:hypothetical protein
MNLIKLKLEAFFKNKTFNLLVFFLVILFLGIYITYYSQPLYCMQSEENILDLGNEVITRLPYDQNVLNSISDLIGEEPILQISNPQSGLTRNITVGELFNIIGYGAIGLASWRIGKSAAEHIFNINKDAIINLLMKTDGTFKSPLNPSFVKSISGTQLGIRLGITGLTSLWLGSIKYYFDSKSLEKKYKMRLDVFDKLNKKLDNNPSILDFESKFRKEFLECKNGEDCSKVFNNILKHINQIDKNNLEKVQTEEGIVYIEKELLKNSNVEEFMNKIKNELEINNVIYESSDSSSLSIDSPFESLFNLSDPYIGIMVMVILTILLTMYLYTIVIINLMNPQFLKINTERFKNKYIILWLKSIEKYKQNSLKLIILMVYICLISALCFMLMLIDLYPSNTS